MVRELRKFAAIGLILSLLLPPAQAYEQGSLGILVSRPHQDAVFSAQALAACGAWSRMAIYFRARKTANNELKQQSIGDAEDTRPASSGSKNRRQWILAAGMAGIGFLLAGSPYFKDWVISWAHGSERLTFLSLEIISIGSKLFVSLLSQAYAHGESPGPFRVNWAIVARQLGVAAVFSALVEGAWYEMLLPYLIPGEGMGPAIWRGLGDQLTSLIFLDPVNQYLKTWIVERKSRQEAMQNISQHSLKFYLKSAPLWLAVVVMANFFSRPIINFSIINIGMILWDFQLAFSDHPSSEAHVGVPVSFLKRIELEFAKSYDHFSKWLCSRPPLLYIQALYDRTKYYEKVLWTGLVGGFLAVMGWLTYPLWAHTFMTNSFILFTGLLVIPCLIADPATAAISSLSASAPPSMRWVDTSESINTRKSGSQLARTATHKASMFQPGAWGLWQTHFGWANVKSIGRLEGFIQNLLLFLMLKSTMGDPLAFTGLHFAFWAGSYSIVFLVIPTLIHYFTGVVDPYDDKPIKRNFKAALGASLMNLLSLAAGGLPLMILGSFLVGFSSVWFVQWAAKLFYLLSFYFAGKFQGDLNVLSILFKDQEKGKEIVHQLPRDVSQLETFGVPPDPIVHPQPDDEEDTHWFRTIWLSDTHLGFRAFKVHDLLDFLRHHESLYLYVVGDFFDFWAFVIKKLWYWTVAHNTVIQKIYRKGRKGTRVIYIPGNHDEAVRRFTPMELGGIRIINAAIHVAADGKRYLIIHGDELDTVIRYSKWLSKLGSWGYDAAYDINPIINFVRKSLGMPEWSLAGYLKKKVKEATIFIDNFEYAAAKAAYNLGLDGVIAGHIHAAAEKIINIEGRDIQYYNTGSWVEGPGGTALGEDFEGHISIIHWHELFGIRKEEMPTKQGLATAA